MIGLVMFCLGIYQVLSEINCSECCSSLQPRRQMRYTYFQNTGRFIGGEDEFTIETYGYSGMNTTEVNGRNNPEAQCIPNTGPAPATIYILGKCSDTMHSGRVITPCSFPMNPVDETQMCNRFAMWIHGCQACSESNPGCDFTAPPCGNCSQGCVVVPRNHRDKLRQGDIIEVLSYDPQVSAKNSRF